MKDKILTEVEVRNLIKMLNSEDDSDAKIAYELIESLDFDKNVGEILLLTLYYKKDLYYSTLLYDKLKKFFKLLNPGSLPKNVYYRAILKHGSETSKKLMIEQISIYYKQLFDDLGYPEEIELEIKLKDNG